MVDKNEGISVEDLVRTKSILENDLEILSTSKRQLQDAQQRFLDNIASLYALGQSSEGEELMLPISSTVYVAGKVKSPERVTIDIGTGYYAEISREEGMQYYKRKIEFIGKEVKKIDQAGGEKKGQLLMIMQALQHHVKQEA